MDARKIEEQLHALTPEEKASIVCAKNWFETVDVPRLGIKSIQMYDGPNGLRKSSQTMEDDSFGHYRAVRATCFPTGSAMGNSWDVSLLRKIGDYLAVECQSEDVPLLLGPSINMKRTPLCGRNFEYYAEDPYLAGKLAAAIVKGIQGKGVGACVKHFAVNNQEDKRLSLDCVISERALREIYLRAFEIAIQDARPYTVMCAYNKVNGLHACRSAHLLKDILKKEWGFDGFVISDWGAMKNRVDSLNAGLDLEMPNSGEENKNNVIKAIRDGTVSEETLNDSVRRILSKSALMNEGRRQGVTYDPQEHHRFAREAAAQCMVLLKNDDGLLPLRPETDFCLIGEMAEQLRYQGGGSSHVNTTGMDCFLDEMRAYQPDIPYAKGYFLDRDDPDEQLEAQAVELAGKHDTVVVVAGLPRRYETEGRDRKSLFIPNAQVSLIRALTQVSRNVVVVSLNGSPIDVSWACDVKGLLAAYLCGQAAGGALADILFGRQNPSGKLAETYPIRIEDTSAYINFSPEKYAVHYGEGIYIGYRYYDKKKMSVAYPFGYGLSYTTFAYRNLRIENDVSDLSKPIKVTADILNTGSLAGKEIVQLYIAPQDAADRPVRELRGFVKVSLAPNETASVSFEIDKSSFSYYNEAIGAWHVDNGVYAVEIAASSRDVRLSTPITIIGQPKAIREIDEDTTIGDLLAQECTRDIVVKLLLDNAPKFTNEYVFSSMSLEDVLKKKVINTPLREARLFSRGLLTDAMIEECVAACNRALRQSR